LLALSVESACASAQGSREKKMKSNSDIKRDAEAELKWDPHIDASDIAVAVKDGVVTLIGFVLIRTTHSARHDFPRRARGR
jgi:osmotically-inducible protein OsmY